MATTNSIALGKASGSIGNVTFSAWKGISVAKQKPATVAQPPSDKRSMQQSAMRQVVAIYRLLQSVISIGFKSLAVKQSQANAFTSYNLLNGFDLTAPPAATISYPDLLFSRGTIANTPVITIDGSEAGGTIEATFSPTIDGAGQSLSDMVIMSAYNETINEWIGSVLPDIRSSGSASLSIPETWVATNAVHTYLSFASADGKASSDSVYTAITLTA